MGEWNELELAFIRHFQQPNIHTLHRQQLKKLSMKSCGGVQRYADEFTRLAGLLGWDFSSRETIYEFKLGLHASMCQRLSDMEGVYMMSAHGIIDSQSSLPLSQYIQCSLNMEANRNINFSE